MTAAAMRRPAAGMLESITTAPQAYARVAGAIYLLVIVFGGYSEGVVMQRLIVPGDMAATAARIAGSMDLWRFATAGDLVVPLIAVAQLWIEYMLLRPAGRSGALLFLLLNAASLGVEIVGKLFGLMVAPILEGRACDGCSAVQRQALAGFALLGHQVGFHVALLLFGAACLVIGVLIWRSAYIPRAIGIGMQVAGVSYILASAGELFFPRLGAAITPWILLPPLVGESAFCLWLLLKGVRRPQWDDATAIAPP